MCIPPKLCAVHAIKISISCLFFSQCLINGLHYVLKTAKASLRLSKEPLCGLNYKLKTKISHLHKQSSLIMLPQHHSVAWLNTCLRVLIKHVFIQILCKLVLRDDTINTSVSGQHWAWCMLVKMLSVMTWMEVVLALHLMSHNELTHNVRGVCRAIELLSKYCASLDLTLMISNFASIGLNLPG